MTAELLDYAAQDAEVVAIAWLSALRRTSSVRQTGDPLPFTLVTHIAGTEDADLGLTDPVISVHTLCDKTLGWVAAKDEADKTHRRMLLLARYQEPIPLPDNSLASVDYVKVFQSPIWVPYENTQILRKVGRYTLGLSYVPAAS